jgi:hypothetical protein
MGRTRRREPSRIRAHTTMASTGVHSRRAHAGSCMHDVDFLPTVSNNNPSSCKTLIHTTKGHGCICAACTCSNRPSVCPLCLQDFCAGGHWTYPDRSQRRCEGSGFSTFVVLRRRSATGPNGIQRRSSSGGDVHGGRSSGAFAAGATGDAAPRPGGHRGTDTQPRRPSGR